MSDSVDDVHQRAHIEWESLSGEYRNSPLFLDVLRILTEHDPMGIAKPFRAENPYW